MSDLANDNSYTLRIKICGKTKKLNTPSYSSMKFSYPSRMIKFFKYVEKS